MWLCHLRSGLMFGGGVWSHKWGVLGGVEVSLEVVVARSLSIRMIVGEDAFCWHSLSERLVFCLADFSVTMEIDHSVVCSALKMKLTLKIRRSFNSKMGRHFSKVRGPRAYWAPQTKKSGGPPPPLAPRFRRLWFDDIFIRFRYNTRV